MRERARERASRGAVARGDRDVDAVLGPADVIVHMVACGGRAMARQSGGWAGGPKDVEAVGDPSTKDVETVQCEGPIAKSEGGAGEAHADRQLLTAALLGAEADCKGVAAASAIDEVEPTRYRDPPLAKSRASKWQQPQGGWSARY